jgi:hypothetical protein
VQVIHAVWTTPEEVEALAASGASVSVSPYTELRIGFGVPTPAAFLAAGIPVGLSVDTPALSGNADMFAIMKAVQNIENGRALDETKLTARRVLELATIEGARSMGLDRTIGSLVPGKRADLIMVNTRQVNMGYLTEPAHLLVEAAQPANVDTVVVDGRILKRGGELVNVDVGAILDEAGESYQAVRKKANWPWPPERPDLSDLVVSPGWFDIVVAAAAPRTRAALRRGATSPAFGRFPPRRVRRGPRPRSLLFRTTETVPPRFGCSPAAHPGAARPGSCLRGAVARLVATAGAGATRVQVTAATARAAQSGHDRLDGGG